MVELQLEPKFSEFYSSTFEYAICPHFRLSDIFDMDIEGNLFNLTLSFF